jgi:hypothetical protein
MSDEKRTFVCCHCRHQFDISEDWSDELAKAEYERIWGKDMGEDKDILCDECNKMFMEWYRTVFEKEKAN